MSIINLTSDETRRVRRIILLQPKPAKIHRKAAILYLLTRSDDVEKIAVKLGVKPKAIVRVLEEFRSKGLDATIAPGDAATEHRKALEDIEKRSPSREKFRAMLERFPTPDRWLDDDDDWDL
jgi:hypothetical protein